MKLKHLLVLNIKSTKNKILSNLIERGEEASSETIEKLEISGKIPIEDLTDWMTRIIENERYVAVLLENEAYIFKKYN